MWNHLKLSDLAHLPNDLLHYSQTPWSRLSAQGAGRIVFPKTWPKGSFKHTIQREASALTCFLAWEFWLNLLVLRKIFKNPSDFESSVRKTALQLLRLGSTCNIWCNTQQFPLGIRTPHSRDWDEMMLVPCKRLCWCINCGCYLRISVRN